MKVLVIFNDYLEAGGERQSVASEVRALEASDITVKLFKIDNEHLAELNTFDRARAVLSNKAVIEDLRSEIRSFKPDIVHAENIFPQLGGAAIKVLHDERIPWVRTIRNYRKGCLAATYVRDGETCTLCSGTSLAVRGVRYACYQSSYKASLGAGLFRLLDSRAEEQYPPGSYISVSKFVADRVANDLVQGVPNHPIHNAVSLPDSIHRLAVSARSHDLCFVGRLEEEKGVRIALDIAESLGRSIVVIGDGSLSREVQARASSSSGRISFCGALSYPNTMATVADSKVVLVPSAWDEPFGRVAAEALAVGALPIVSNRGGLPEIVSELEYDAVVESYSIDAWRIAVLNLLTRADSELNLLSQSAMRQWARSFSESALATQLVGVYSSVTERYSVGQDHE